MNSQTSFRLERLGIQVVRRIVGRDVDLAAMILDKLAETIGSARV
jgi:hypothetical protein